MRAGKMLVPHLGVGAALEAYRGERDAVRRSHLQVIWLLLSGETASVVARVTGFSLRWIDKLVARWNAEGQPGPETAAGRPTARQWRGPGSGCGGPVRLGGGAGAGA